MVSLFGVFKWYSSRLFMVAEPIYKKTPG